LSGIVLEDGRDTRLRPEVDVVTKIAHHPALPGLL
jgi:hypothetical protein